MYHISELATHRTSLRDREEYILRDWIKETNGLVCRGNCVFQ